MNILRLSFWLIALLALLGSGCSHNCRVKITPLPGEVRNDTDRTDIMEAVFRHMCQPEGPAKENSHKVNPVHKVYFLRIGRSEDPSPELLKRLADLQAPVKPVSAGVWKKLFIYDKVSDERGASFGVDSIVMRSANEVEAEGTINPGGGLSASGHIYQLARKNGKWVVVSQKLKWIS